MRSLAQGLETLGEAAGVRLLGLGARLEPLRNLLEALAAGGPLPVAAQCIFENDSYYEAGRSVSTPLAGSGADAPDPFGSGRGSGGGVAQSPRLRTLGRARMRSIHACTGASAGSSSTPSRPSTMMRGAKAMSASVNSFPTRYSCPPRASRRK